MKITNERMLMEFTYVTGTSRSSTHLVPYEDYERIKEHVHMALLLEKYAPISPEYQEAWNACCVEIDLLLGLTKKTSK